MNLDTSNIWAIKTSKRMQSDIVFEWPTCEAWRRCKPVLGYLLASLSRQNSTDDWSMLSMSSTSTIRTRKFLLKAMLPAWCCHGHENVEKITWSMVDYIFAAATAANKALLTYFLTSLRNKSVIDFAEKILHIVSAGELGIEFVQWACHWALWPWQWNFHVCNYRRRGVWVWR